jgi:hypothetical protein
MNELRRDLLDTDSDNKSERVSPLSEIPFYSIPGFQSEYYVIILHVVRYSKNY